MIRQACIRVHEVENQADDLYHHAVSDFFKKEKDAIELIKKKEVLANDGKSQSTGWKISPIY